MISGQEVASGGCRGAFGRIARLGENGTQVRIGHRSFNTDLTLGRISLDLRGGIDDLQRLGYRLGATAACHVGNGEEIHGGLLDLSPLENGAFHRWKVKGQNSETFCLTLPPL